MRLLDLIAQSGKPFIAAPQAGAAPMVLTGPGDFSRQIADCPLRFVISDDLTRASAELAFADGIRLAGCLDLLRIPAAQLWVEWSDAIHQQVIHQCGTILQGDSGAPGRQAGVLLRVESCGRSGMARTFWSVPRAAAQQPDVQMSPLETYIDLDDTFEPIADTEAMFRGECASLTQPHDAGLTDLLHRVRFRFDEKWLKYYSAAARDAPSRECVARKSLAAVAHDAPLLMAFFLLLNAKGATRPQPVERSTLNRKRLAQNRAPLLDHIEVHATLPGSLNHDEEAAENGFSMRHSPRLHHVRGHPVRRDDRVFWRTPHLRGNAHRGVVRSRTVCLSFSSAG
jgi:hypothetical protein